MSLKEKFGVAWIGLMSSVSIMIIAQEHHNSIAGGILTGITCCIIGWWIL